MVVMGRAGTAHAVPALFAFKDHPAAHSNFRLWMHGVRAYFAGNNAVISAATFSPRYL